MPSVLSVLCFVCFHKVLSKELLQAYVTDWGHFITLGCAEVKHSINMMLILMSRRIVMEKKQNTSHINHLLLSSRQLVVTGRPEIGPTDTFSLGCREDNELLAIINSCWEVKGLCHLRGRRRKIHPRWYVTSRQSDCQKGAAAVSCVWWWGLIPGCMPEPILLNIFSRWARHAITPDILAQLETMETLLSWEAILWMNKHVHPWCDPVALSEISDF